MSNVLKVNLRTAIYSLTERGWSQRRIARELGVNRETVGRYLLARAKPAIPTAGSEESGEPKPAISTAGDEESGKSKPAISTPGNGVGRKSQCEPLAEVIAAKVESGLSAQRIFQDVVAEHGFTDSYESVKRFVRKLRAREPERVWRLEGQPGEEAQVDFGLGAPIQDGPGKSRRSWVLRVVLSYSRKAYSEAVTRQDTETFLRCLENALRSFGGVPLMLNVDNLKAAVLKADWFDPEINPKMADFCRHYGTHVVPCRPRTPEHKGKVERGVAYKFSRTLGSGGWSAPVKSSCRYWVSRAAVLGEPCGAWAQAALDARGPEALRSIMALCKLIEKHSARTLNAACGKALAMGSHRLKDVRRLIGEPLEQGTLDFAQSHSLIRDLRAYSDFIQDQSEPNPPNPP